MKLFFFVVICSLGVLAVENSFRLPVGSIVLENDSSGKTWNQNGLMNVTFVSAMAQFKSTLKSQGWKETQHINMGKEKKQAIMTWQRGDDKITLMLWKINTNTTGFSWGRYK